MIGMTHITGAEEALTKLRAVSATTRGKGSRFALRKAAGVVKAAAVAGAQRIDDKATREEIAKNITIRWSSKFARRTGDMQFRVGVLGGARQPDTAKKQRRRARSGAQSLSDLGEIVGKGAANPGGDTFYWRFLEFGTSKIPAGRYSFMRRALSDNTGAATDEFVRQLNKAIDRAVAKGTAE